jgi:hypothetical protein
MKGFTITTENMTKAKRNLWNPKQEHRAYRRGFFLVPHETGPHLHFSSAMAQESFLHLINGITYKKLPEEWCTERTQQGLEKVAQSASDWFENLVIRKVRSLGAQGDRYSKTIGLTSRIRIPQEVGDLDFD